MYSQDYQDMLDGNFPTLHDASEGCIHKCFNRDSASDPWVDYDYSMDNLFSGKAV